jgi:hypothetical protein
VRNSCCNGGKWSTATAFTTQRVLWDIFLVLGVFAATCCLALHLAGLNDFNTPISIEYAEGNWLAILFFCSSLSLMVAAGLLYRCFGQWIAALLSLMVLLFLVTVIATRPNSNAHFCAFYATLLGAILAPLVALWKLKLWARFLGLNAVLVTVILLLYWAGTKDLDIAGFGMAQRIGVIVAWLSNFYVLNHCRQSGRGVQRFGKKMGARK